MEKCLPFKSFTGALFFLALLFIMYDPPEIHSQCVDVSSSPCYVNISDIPYEMFEYTAYSSRDKAFYESIRDESIYVDTCNTDWLRIALTHIYYKYHYFWFDEELFKSNLDSGDYITVNEIKDEFQPLKDIFIEFESKYCKIQFLLLQKFDGIFYIKTILENHLLDDDFNKFWSYGDYWTFLGGLMIVDPTDVEDSKKLENIILISNNNNLEIKNDFSMYDQEITIYDYLGLKQIESTIKSNLTNIDISSLSRGIYFVRINNKIYKFMKE